MINCISGEPRREQVVETGECILDLRGLSKVFLTDDVETHALEGVNMQVSCGEYVCISGPSGCGKSTLLSIVGLLDVATSGQYLLGGHDTMHLTQRQRSRLRNAEIGFIFQSFNLIGDLTVNDNVELPLRYRGLSRRERASRVGAVLDRVGMTHRRWHYPSQLSGGQQQRVAVARALSGRPRILLADEPTGNLDSSSGEAVMSLLRELHESGATICMVTHDLRFSQYAQRTVSLLDGRVVDDTGGRRTTAANVAEKGLR